MTRTSRLALYSLALVFTFFNLAPLASSASKKSTASEYVLFVGTYTDKGSKGIYSYTFDSASSKLTPLGLAAETSNPSFLAVDPSRRFVYAVNENQKYKGANSGGVSAFAIERDASGRPSGKLKFLNETASRGADPCYIAFDKTGKYALVANYTGGSVAVFPVNADGRVGDSSSFVQHSGSGVNRERQEGPHAHWIETTLDNHFAVAADLGLDKLLVYRFDATNGSLAANDPPYAQLDPGEGPRHVAFHPNGKNAYVVNEVQNSVTAFSYDPARGEFHKQATLSTLPKDFSGSNTTAEIKVHPSGKFVFVSNRGHDSIAVFAIDGRSAALTLVGYFSTQGKNPRDFAIDPTGKFLLAANQDSDNIVVFRIDQKAGRLTPTGQAVQAPTPVCLKFMAVN